MPDTLRILLHNDETESLERALKTRFPEFDCAVCKTYRELPAAIETFRPNVVYTVRFAGTPGYPRDALFEPNGPLWVANGGAGTDHFGAWDPDQIVVTNTAGVAANMMAEYILGGFLHFTLDIPGLQADKEDRQWRARKVAPLAGKTLLIVGLGHTGRALAKRANAFGMTVLGTRASPRETPYVDETHAADNLPKLLPRADFIAVSTPLTPKTRGLIGAPEIAAMRAGVIFADVSRGGVVDQPAMCDALRSGHIAGAALDVFEVEPLPKASPLWDTKNVIISPHCSSVFAGWEDASFELFLDNLARWHVGETLLNVVDPRRGY